MRPSPRFAVTAALLAAVPLVGFTLTAPGVVFEITTVDHTRSPAETHVGLLQVQGPDLSMEVTGAEGSGRVIFRGDAREMLVIDDADRSYMVLDQATLESLAGQMNAAMAQMERMLESLPPEQRAMMERMRGEGGMPGMPSMEEPEVEVRRTGRSDERAGFSVGEWEVLEDGVVVRRLWIAPWSALDGAEEARDALTGMVTFFDGFLDALPRMPGSDASIRNPFRSVDMTEGMPVVTEELAADGTVEMESTVTAVEQQSVDPAVFLPPEGYTRRELPGG